MTQAFSVGFILCAIFVACVILFGVFLLFVRAERIERNVLVGCMTLLTAMVAGGLLAHDASINFPYGTGSLVSICLLSVLGFAVGRGVDYLLGPLEHDADSREATLGADLAD